MEGDNSRPRSRLIAIVGRSSRLQMREFFAEPLALIVTVVQPGAFTLLLVWLDPSAGAGRALDYGVSMGLLALWASAVWSSGTILYQDRAEGTLATVLLGSDRPLAVLVGRTLGSVLAATVMIVASVGVVVVLAVDTASARLLLLIPLGFVIALTTIPLGVMLASLFILSRSAIRIAESLLYPGFILSGILIPLQHFPPVLRIPARAFSLYWAHEVISAELGAEPYLGPLGYFVLLSGIYMLVGGLSFGYVVRRSRREGSLDLI